ncbi:MAG: VCBS repeat-containing protein [Woeseiaceae bacterium]|nr:VCBS repeat-containing protein [Woeseiaceae bacterium]
MIVFAGHSMATPGGYSDEERDGVLSVLLAQGHLNLSVIYVTFPGETTVQMNDAMVDVHDGISTLYDQQSDGAFSLNTNIIWNPATGDSIWTADYAVEAYSSLASVQSFQRYGDAWECLDPAHQEVTTGLNVGYVGELQAEIMIDIEQTYNGMDSPFDGGDMLLFVFCTDVDQQMFGWAGGFARVMIDFDYFPLLAGMNPDLYPGGYQGDYCRPVHGITMKWDDVHDYVTRFGPEYTHELMHVFTGTGHEASSPIPCCEIVDGETHSYNYGTYSIRRRESHREKPFVPYKYNHLQEIGWLPPTVDITETTRGVRLNEIRQGGTVIRVPTGAVWTFEGTDGMAAAQYFEIAFHGGIEEDALLDRSGRKMYPSIGLAIWHVVHTTFDGVLANGHRPGFVDLESSFGLYSDPGPFDESDYWQNPDPVAGFDNHDTWYDRENECALRLQDEARHHFGSVYDFWSKSRDGEFSYRTNPETNNPTTASYDFSQFGLYPAGLRYLDQSIENSLVIKIVEQGADYAIIDVLFAPNEDILIPAESDTFLVGQQADITWTTGHAIIDTCDIYASYDGGDWIEIATDVYAPSGSYTWTPAVPSADCRLKMVFENETTDHVGEYLMPSGFAISPNLLVEPALEAVHSEQTLLLVVLEAVNGDPLVAVWIDASELGLSAQLELSDDGLTGGDWVAGDGVWTADIAGYQATPPPDGTLPIFAEDAAAETYAGELLVTFLEQVPEIYYRNVSREVDGLAYSGTPTGLAPTNMVYAGGQDDYRDFVMTQMEAGAVAIVHPPHEEDVPDLQNDTDYRFPSGAPGSGHGPAGSADFDGDGLLDLVITAGHSTDGVRFLRQTASGQYQEMPSWNSLPDTLEAGTWSVACGDYDGDGQVDVFLGRAEVPAGEFPGPDSGGLPDVLLRNDLVNSGRFVDASEQIEIPIDPVTQEPIHVATGAAQWFDLDRDYDLDLAIADIGTGRGWLLYLNNELAAPQPLGCVFSGDPTAGDATDLVVADLDDVAGPNFLVSFADAASEPRMYTYEDLPTGPPVTFKPMTAAKDVMDVSGLRVLDSDLDGDLDIILLPRNDGDAPLLWLNDGDANFTAGPDHGLAALTGATTCAYISNLNNDGASDLFLGRVQDQQRFLSIAGGQSPDWAGVRLLESPTNPVPVSNASVTFSNDAWTQVSGGERNDLTLRSGTAGENLTCDIRWPSGQYDQDVPVLADSTLTFYLETDYGLDQGFLDQPTVKVTVRPDCGLNYTLNWSTSYQIDMRATELEIDGATVLDYQSPAVTMAQWPDPVNSTIPRFGHELTWVSYDCVPRTTVTLKIRCGRGIHEIESNEIQHLNKFCPTCAP